MTGDTGHNDFQSALASAGAAAGPRTSRAVVGLFLSAVFAVPTVQTVWELAQGRTPPLADVFRKEFRARRLHEFERRLTEESVFRGSVRALLRRAPIRIDADNRHVVVGPDGRLYARPGLNHVVGRGILHSRRAAPAGDQPAFRDPVPCIVGFHRECGRRGIALVVLVVPDKAAVHRLGVGGGFAGNADEGRVFAALRAAGVNVYNPLDDPAAGEPGFLDYDTHWTPEWMEAVAGGLAAHIRRTTAGLGPPPAHGPELFVRDRRFSYPGDLPLLVDAAHGSARFPPMDLRLREVVDAAGNPWMPDPAADALLLGDSFAYMFSVSRTGSDCAGLSPHLSRLLGRRLDAFEVAGLKSADIRAEFLRAPERLRGRTLVIWEFAAWGMTAYGWPPIFDGPDAPRGPAGTPPVPAGAATVLAELLTAPPAIDPTASPYADALAVLKFRVKSVQSGTYDKGEALVVLPIMRGRKLLPAATLQIGRAYRLTLTREIPAEMRTWRRLDGTGEFDLPEMFAPEATDR